MVLNSKDKGAGVHVEITQAPVPVSELVLNWVVAEYGHLRNASKIVARLASSGAHQVSHRTTQGWLSKRSKPCPESIEILTARCDDLAASIDEQRHALRELIKAGI